MPSIIETLALIELNHPASSSESGANLHSRIVLRLDDAINYGL